MFGKQTTSLGLLHMNLAVEGQYWGYGDLVTHHEALQILRHWGFVR